MDKFFLKVLHEEPLDRLTLESIKGGLECKCYGKATLTCSCFKSLVSCDCFGGSDLDCLVFD